MNPFKVSFVSLGFIYFLILLWGITMGFGGTIGISLVGLLICSSGWKISDRYLQ